MLGPCAGCRLFGLRCGGNETGTFCVFLLVDFTVLGSRKLLMLLEVCSCRRIHACLAEFIVCRWRGSSLSFECVAVVRHMTSAVLEYKLLIYVGLAMGPGTAIRSGFVLDGREHPLRRNLLIPSRIRRPEVMILSRNDFRRNHPLITPKP